MTLAYLIKTGAIDRSCVNLQIRTLFLSSFRISTREKSSTGNRRKFNCLKFSSLPISWKLYLFYVLLLSAVRRNKTLNIREAKLWVQFDCLVLVYIVQVFEIFCLQAFLISSTADKQYYNRRQALRYLYVVHLLWVYLLAICHRLLKSKLVSSVCLALLVRISKREGGLSSVFGGIQTACPWVVVAESTRLSFSSSFSVQSGPQSFWWNDGVRRAKTQASCKVKRLHLVLIGIYSSVHL